MKEKERILDGILEAKMLLTITASDVLAGSITFGPDEWQDSYDDGA
ncbi:MAG TPA: hypothetical protein H9911_10865 [Candidatus Mediterraneibacter tabaqchaliae]|uniref:Uncharacterized protein n=1 Tax=Candidatus Mediterraneibacter tabaqchaliae TaxID=2838689 RepID=A0A9D2U349_9FIRM|nr:hypothetical protein [Candidatus Mediterraneibacter tabaqchaliae]